MSQTDDLLENNRRHAADRPASGLSSPPKRRVAVVACMDARLDVYRVLGLEAGDAHVIRNAGGVVTDDVVRSLCVSQRALGTREVILVHHTDCGMGEVDEPAFLAELESDAGARPAWRLQGFTDAVDSVGESMETLRRSPFLSDDATVRGFVFDVDSGALEEVVAAGPHRDGDER